MKYLHMMLHLLILTSICYASVSDSNNLANDGVLSIGEYGSNVKVKDTSILTVDGGGAYDIYTFNTSHLEVLSTSQPLVFHVSGITDIDISDYSTLTFSGGVANSIEVYKNATAYIDGGQINYIQSIQKPSLGETITIYCQYDSWSWIGEKDAYTGITGLWENGEEFTITFVNDHLNIFPDTWTHVRVIPEPATMLMLGLGGLLLKRRAK